MCILKLSDNIKDWHVRNAAVLKRNLLQLKQKNTKYPGSDIRSRVALRSSLGKLINSYIYY